MPRHISLEPYLTHDDLEARYRQSHEAVERSHWHFLWLLARGMTAIALARGQELLRSVGDRGADEVRAM